MTRLDKVLYTAKVRLPGLAHEVAQALADEAHQTCPCSKATRGKIDVAINVFNSQLPNRTEEIQQ
jgi:organic hydroperoxide reductase OsmC/OhrA